MKTRIKNKKILAGLTFIGIFAIVFSVVFFASAAQAPAPAPGGSAPTDLQASPWWSLAAKYAVGGFGAIGVAIMQILALLAWLIGGVFDYAIDLNLDFSSNMSVITIGWTIARDIANIFFILVLLTIAIMTILRVSSYQAKTMFFKFVVIALLINFSLSFGLILIDFTNILGKGFYDAMRPGGQAISTTIISGAKLQNVWNFQQPPAGSQQNFKNLVMSSIPGGIGTLYDVLTKLFGTATDTLEQAVAFAKIAWGNTILLAVMIFVMIVATAFLLIRVAVLAILLVVSPIAFIAMILPKAEHIWQKWWSTFFSHAFFFPSFLFLMYFSVLFVSRISSAAASSNFLNSPELLTGYFIAIVMMIGALIIAKQMGVYGADAVMKTATTGRQWVAGYAGRNTIGRFGERLQQNQTLQSTRMGRKFTAAMAGTGGKSTGSSMRQIREEKAEWLAKQSPAEWAKGYKNLGASGREKFIQSIPEQARGKFLADLKANDPAMYDATMNTLKVRLGAKQLKDFEKAEMQYGMKGLKGAALAGHIGSMSPDEQKKNFKAMADSQRSDLANEWASSPANMTKLKDWADSELDLAEQGKFFEESGRRMLQDTTKIATIFDTLPEEFKNSIIEKGSKEDLQRIASQTASPDKFIDDIMKRAPTKAPDVISILPSTANASKIGKTAAQVIVTADLSKVPDSHLAATPGLAKDIAENMRSKQIQQVMDRGGKLATDVLAEIKSIANQPHIAKDLKKLADEYENVHKNTSMAGWLRSKPTAAKAALNL